MKNFRKRAMSCSIVFLEYEEQIEAFLEDVGGIAQDVQCIAVYPEIYEMALRANLSVRPLDDFGHVASLAPYNVITTAKIEQLTTLFDSLWDSLTGDIACARCISLRAFFHPLKGYYDALVKRALPIQNALALLRPEQVYVFPVAYDITGFNLLAKPPKGLTSLLTPFLAALKNIPVVSVKMDGQRNGPSFPSSLPPSIPFDTACSLLAHAEQHDDSTPRIKIARNALLTYSYIMEDQEYKFTRDLSSAGISVLPAYPQATATTLSKPILIQVCRSIAHKVADVFLLDLTDQMTIDNINLSPFIKPYLEAMLRNKLVDLLSLSMVANSFYAKFENSVLLSGGMSLESFVLTRAAKRAGLKTINLHRGGMLGYSAIPTLERYDMGEADYYFVNGRGAAQNFAQPCAGSLWPEGYPRAKPIPVGAAWVWDIYKKRTTQKHLPNKNLRICYILEADIADYGYLGGLVRPAFQHYLTEKSVIDIFNNHPAMQLFVKGYPKNRFNQDTEFILDYIRTSQNELSQNNITILDQCSIASIANSFDVFILDYPGTPLMELAASGKTIVLYIDEDCYSLYCNAKQILTECTHYFSKLEHFLNFVETFCHDTTILTQKSMQPFLSTFVLPSSEQSPSTTIQKFVTRLIN